MHQSRDESVLSSYYHDAFIHTEDKKIFSVHKVMLAMYSPFLHSYFQSRPGNEVNDIFFQNANSNMVKSALELVYNGNVNIETNCMQSFKWFLKTILQVDVQEVDESSIPNTVTEPTFQNTDPVCEITVIPESDIIEKEEQTVRHQENIDDEEETGTASTFCSAWTLTSVSENMLAKIYHSGATVPKKGRLYTCNICKSTTKTYPDASNHFKTKHQNYEVERIAIENAVKSRKICLTKLCSIRKDIEKGCNITMANSQLEAMSEELTEHLDVVSDLDKTKLLPDNLLRKTRELCHALNGTVKEIHMIINLNAKK